MSFVSPTLLTPDHVLESFDCGQESLNLFLKRFALTHCAIGAARTYVTTQAHDAGVIGYYSLSAGSVQKVHTPERVAKGLSNHPVPVVLLARLAVDLRFKARAWEAGSFATPWRAPAQPQTLSRRSRHSGPRQRRQSCRLLHPIRILPVPY